MPENMKYTKKKATYSYLSDADRETIEACCYTLRKTKDSRQNLFYIIVNFGEYCEKSVFEADTVDALRYLEFLSDEIDAKRLEEKYGACLFMELRRFYDCALSKNLVTDNPLAGMSNPFQMPDKIYVSDLPTLTDVDLLLQLCDNHPVLFLAVLLAFRLTLPINEIVNLEKSQFCIDESDANMYLKAWRWVEGEKKELFLLIPRDMVPYVRKVAASSPAEYKYLIRNQKNRPYTARSLQRLLADVQEDTGIKVQFSELRSLGIYLMLAEQIPIKEICSFANVRGDWLTRYNEIPEELKLDTANYVHIRIK